MRTIFVNVDPKNNCKNYFKDSVLFRVPRKLTAA
jgi:hypothetical protein